MDVAPIERVAEQGGDQPLVHTFAHTPRPPFPSPPPACRGGQECVTPSSPPGCCERREPLPTPKPVHGLSCTPGLERAVIRQACEVQKETFDQVTRDRYCND
jgi:hypothetical protein